MTEWSKAYLIQEIRNLRRERLRLMAALHNANVELERWNNIADMFNNLAENRGERMGEPELSAKTANQGNVVELFPKRQ